MWRRAHYLNFPVWLLATLHGLGSGTDRHTLWLLALELASVAAVLVALALRLAKHFPGRPAGRARRRRRGRRAPRSSGMAAVAPDRGLRSLEADGEDPGGRTSPSRSRAASSGRTAPGTVLVSLSGEGTGKRHVLVRFDLLGDNGQLARSEIQLRFADGGATCVGSVSDLQSTSIAGDCSFADGTTRTVQASWAASRLDRRGRLEVRA